MRRSRAFGIRHEQSLADLFTAVLSLCKEAGLVKVGLIAIDGTKVHPNASHHCNLDYEQIVREILKEAAEVDAAEDELFGDARGDELPPEFRSTGELRKRLREASSAWTPSARPSRSRARAHARNACGKPRSVLSKSSSSSAV